MWVILYLQYYLKAVEYIYGILHYVIYYNMYYIKDDIMPEAATGGIL